MSKNNNAPTFREGLVILADALLRAKISNRGYAAIGCVALLVLVPLLCTLGGIFIFVAQTNAWLVWFAVGFLAGVLGLKLFQVFRQRRRAAKKRGEQ